MSLVLVTGGTGFIGSYLVRRLLLDRPESRIRLLTRRPEGISVHLRDAVDVVQGDLRDRAAVRTAVEGADLVLNLGALARAWSADPDDFRRVNVGALAGLLDESARSGVGKFVHVSSVVAGTCTDPRRNGHGNGNGDHRSHGRDRRRSPTPYELSKREGERLVLDYMASGSRAVIVRPTRVFGPGPLHDANGVTKMIALYLGGRFRVRVADGDVLGNYVHADDVARGILLAASRPTPSPYYLLGGENVSIRGLLRIASEISGIRRVVLPIPRWAGVAIGGAAELAALAGRTPLLTRAWVRTFLEDWPADIGPARRDLGYEPRPLREGLADTIAWIRRTHVAGVA